VITSKEEDRASINNFRFKIKERNEWYIPRQSDEDEYFQQMMNILSSGIKSAGGNTVCSVSTNNLKKD
jgi:hypothetical protein